MVTQLVAVGATALAVLAGIVFAQQADGTTKTSDPGSGTTGDTDRGTDGSTDGNTNDDGAWPPVQTPGADSGGFGPAHGSSGAS